MTAIMIFEWIFFIPVGNKDNHKKFDNMLELPAHVLSIQKLNSGEQTNLCSQL